MTPHFSSWLFSRNPRILLIVLASLWIAQMAFWAIWEWRREPISVTLLSEDRGSTQSVLSVEAPLSDVIVQEIPESPFLSRNPDVLSRYFDYADERPGGSDVTSAYPEPDVPVSASTSDASAPSDSSLLVPAETNAVDFAKTLCYHGFLQTAKGVRIAFVEDLESASTHRLRVGERFKEWTLKSIERGQVVLTSDQAVDLTILRQMSDAPVVSKESAAAPELAVTPVEAEPQSETNSAPAQEVPEP